MRSLIYTSLNRSVTTPEQLRELESVSARRNQKSGITGILLAGEGRFVQYLEGPRRQVEETFARISRDSRHTDVQVVYFETILKRSLPRWSMQCVNTESFENSDHFSSDYFRKNLLMNPYAQSLIRSGTLSLKMIGILQMLILQEESGSLQSCQGLLESLHFRSKAFSNEVLGS